MVSDGKPEPVPHVLTDEDLRDFVDDKVVRLKSHVAELRAFYDVAAKIADDVFDFVDQVWGDAINGVINAEGSRRLATKAQFLHALLMDIAWEIEGEIKCAYERGWTRELPIGMTQADVDREAAWTKERLADAGDRAAGGAGE